ncbi:DNA repair protein RadC [Kiloniella laminariae]|uniref:DNA repair protein RadC n=1 Tax=Kiloniella laminariae TaxID=454162 RepID=A0ABT4LHM4_9PROT|nr:DNA repair protein RadC [Kiloniella laminariae]MCZ4280595.1 DNA repair protein RadC [Kiloniella laminariae]
MQKDKPHFHGHRERLRQRLLDKGAESFADYEVLECLLFGANPRGDTKPLAKKLIEEFGSLAGVFAAAPEELEKISGMGNAAISLVKIVPEAARRMSKTTLLDQPLINSWEKLVDYCQISMSHERIEQFRLLFLDRKNRLIADEVQQKGTVDHTPVYPREVVKRALELNASAFIMVHNHPSGDPTPSAADLAMTREVKAVCQKLGIELHDHLIISRSGHSSMRNLGLL